MTQSPTEVNQEIFDILPGNLIYQIKEHTDNLVQEFSTLTFSVPRIDENIVLNPFNQSFIEVLKTIYKTNLLDLYDLHGILVNKVGYDANYIDKITFAESIILLNGYIKQQAKEKEELEKQQKASK